MFSKVSRYRKLPDVVAISARGRELKSRDIRLLPDVPGIFEHTVEEGDRLNHLAFKYYKQPRNWWRICDANPDFMSPQALLGKEPLTTQRFNLTYAGNETNAPWAVLLSELRKLVGVEDVLFVEELELAEEVKELNWKEVKEFNRKYVVVSVEHFQYTIIIEFNETITSRAELIARSSTHDFELTNDEIIGRVGKKIMIPRDAIG